MGTRRKKPRLTAPVMRGLREALGVLEWYIGTMDDDSREALFGPDKGKKAKDLERAGEWIGQMTEYRRGKAERAARETDNA